MGIESCFPHVSGFDTSPLVFFSSSRCTGREVGQSGSSSPLLSASLLPQVCLASAQGLPTAHLAAARGLDRTHPSSYLSLGPVLSRQSPSQSLARAQPGLQPGLQPPPNYHPALLPPAASPFHDFSNFDSDNIKESYS